MLTVLTLFGLCHLFHLFHSKGRTISVNPYIIITIGATLVVIGIILFNMGKSLQNKNQKKSGTFTLIGFILLTAGLILLLTAIRVLFS